MYKSMCDEHLVCRLPLAWGGKEWNFMFEIFYIDF